MDRSSRFPSKCWIQRVHEPGSGPLTLDFHDRTGLAIRTVVRRLRPLRSATIASNGSQQTFPPDVPTQEQAINDAIQGEELRH